MPASWPMSSADDGSFPRLRDLIAGIAPSKQRKAWQWDFERIVAEDGQRWGHVEATLINLPDAAWQSLKATILSQIDLRNPARGWLQAIPLLNEARAHDYLVRHGYHDVEFLAAQIQAKSPDLRATRDGKILFCEVKTLRLARRHSLAGNLHVKLAKRLRDAIQQLAAMDDVPTATRMIYIVLDISDGLRPMADEIRERIDIFLAGGHLSGIAIVIDENESVDQVIL